MKLSRYNQFITEAKINRYVDEICNKYDIKNYTINEDESIDVNGNVNMCNDRYLAQIPIQFRNINGNFYCHNNNLLSLANCPKKVRGHFNCSLNLLTSLEGSPNIVEGNFYCHHNNLSSLKGISIIYGDIAAQHNKIKDLNGFPENYEGYLQLYNNPLHKVISIFTDGSKTSIVKVINLFNEYDVIHGNKVILRRLDEVAYELKMILPENLTFENYEII